MITEDDDDTHICLKCHVTITGLDNYVTHRKSSCGPQPSKPRTLSPLIPPDEPDFALKADDFFSLLELQSSSKKSTLQVPSGGKSNSGVLTRSKATAVIQASNINRGSDWIGGHQLRELGNEDNQTKLIKAVDNISGNIKKDEPTRLSYEDDLEEESNDEYEDDEEDFEEECHNHNAPPRSHTGGKWKPTTSPIQWLRPSSSHSHEYRNEDRQEDQNWDNPPPSHTGGKWKPMLPSNTHSSPHTHSSSHLHSQTHLHPQTHLHQTNLQPHLHPHPQSRRHSEGEDEEDKEDKEDKEEKDDKEDKNAPPPDHTKGKWIPGRIESSNQICDIPPLRKSSGTVQYWCGPCNRHLASKVVYDRHLKSDLHYKRTLHEREFDRFESTSEYLTQKTVEIKKRAEGKRKIKKPEHLWIVPDVKKNKPNLVIKKERIKKQNYIRCDVCRSKVLTHLMGKHLISHYHCRKRNILKPISEQMVLDHILGIVLQSPFQCSPCRFFCNEETQFLQHWRSDLHLSSLESSLGYFLCTFCKYETKYNEIMEQHLLSDSHREVVSVINRSVPIIIKRIVPIKCGTCDKIFRYNAELRKHCLRENHVVSNSSTDKYQDRHCCLDCEMVLKSYKALQRHMLKKHRKNLYFCSICTMTFETELESKLHRKTSQHKYEVITKNYEKGFNTKDISRECQYCFLKFVNMMYLKQHLQKKHPEHSYSCPQCGLKFTLPQEVTQHIKSKSCSFPSTSSSSSSHFFTCEKCPYKSNSEADFLFHLALHTDPVPVLYSDTSRGESSRQRGDNIVENIGGSVAGAKGKKVVMYKCPVCDKIFRKSSLRCHVRHHVNERPFKCQHCKAAYTRKSNLADHIKARHGEEYKKKRIEEMQNHPVQGFEETGQLRQQNEDNEEGMKKNEEQKREKKFLCADCGKSFLKRFTLQQHACTHIGKDFPCTHPGCVYHARTLAELRNHSVTHTDIKPFACTQCSYRTKSKAQLNRHMRIHQGDEGKRYACPFCAFSARVRSHLKRHLRLHTGAKPYRCPHCTYSCNNLENLRKHILSTNKHPGKSIYTCTWCSPPEEEYATNFAKEFHVHLVTTHSDQFDAASAKEAASRLLGIYNKEEDEKVVEDRGNDSSKRFKLSLSSPLHSSSSNILLPSTSSSRLVERTLIPTSSSTTLVDPELLSMVVVKEDVVFVGEAWAMEGFYDEQGLLGSEFDEDD